MTINTDDLFVNASGHLVTADGGRATNEEWQVWIEGQRRERSRYRAKPSGVVAQTDPETGVVLMEGDEGYNPISQPLAAGHTIGAVLSATDRAAVIAKAQALDTVKAHENLRHRRLVAVRNHEAPPGTVAHDYQVVGSKSYDASDCEREVTRIAAMRHWEADGGGSPTVFVPKSGAQAVAERVESDALSFALRHHEALFTLSATTPAERDLKARPLRARALFDYSGIVGK